MKAGLRSLKLTYEDYLHFPQDGRRHEILDGEHFVVPAPTLRHQSVVSNLHLALGLFVRTHRLGRVWTAPVDVVLSDVDILQPDLVFVAESRGDLLAGTHVQGAPDLVVEVLSPSTRRTDLVTKRHLYEKHGVSEYWVVDPEIETVEIYRLTENGFRREAQASLEGGEDLRSPLFPGLVLELREIFF
jgi:Uma2 family endonuclease